MLDNQQEVKICTECKKEKLLTDFHWAHKDIDRHHHCKVCRGDKKKAKIKKRGETTSQRERRLRGGKDDEKKIHEDLAKLWR